LEEIGESTKFARGDAEKFDAAALQPDAARPPTGPISSTAHLDRMSVSVWCGDDPKQRS
jgi:hypothetical protein